MNKKAGNFKWLKTTARAVLFWLCCAAALAVLSGLIRGNNIFVSQVLPICLSAAVALLLTLLFVRWERLRLTRVGIIPGRLSITRFLAGLAIGLAMAAFQPFILWCTGHVGLQRTPGVNLALVAVNLFLYFAISCREELAFRGYPLQALASVTNPWAAQSIVALLFIIEHIAGGMTWLQAIIGSGTGAVLFGLAAIRTRGLALPVGLHFAWNSSQWVFGFKITPGVYHLAIDKGFEHLADMAGWAAYLLPMWCTILALYCWKSTVVKEENRAEHS